MKVSYSQSMLDAVKAMGSKNQSQQMAAANAIAQVISAPLLGVIQGAPVFSNMFQGAISRSSTLRAENSRLVGHIQHLEEEIAMLKRVIGC